MEVADGGKTYYISGLWDPAVRDLLVLNTETPKGRCQSNVYQYIKKPFDSQM